MQPLGCRDSIYHILSFFVPGLQNCLINFYVAFDQILKQKGKYDCSQCFFVSFTKMSTTFCHVQKILILAILWDFDFTKLDTLQPNNSWQQVLYKGKKQEM